MIKRSCIVCKKDFYVVPSILKRDGRGIHCSSKCKAESQKGKKMSEKTKINMSNAQRGEKNHFFGKKHTIDARRKISEVHRGENHRSWKGGITPKNEAIRKSFEYRLWREAVFKRDNYTCIWCGDDKGGNLNADHIKPFAHYPELRFAIDNGRTLCFPCHKTTFTYGRTTKS